MKSKRGDIYTVIVLGEKSLTDDLEDCLKVSCTNKKSLELITEIPYDRLLYVFTRLGKSMLLDKGCFIVRSSSLYKGRQGEKSKNRSGGSFTGYNRNR